MTKSYIHMINRVIDKQCNSKPRESCQNFLLLKISLANKRDIFLEKKNERDLKHYLSHSLKQ